MRREGDAAHVHAEESGDEIDRQGRHGDNGQNEECPVGLLVDLGGELLRGVTQILKIRRRSRVAAG